jgi:hypothetical protein
MQRMLATSQLCCSQQSPGRWPILNADATMVSDFRNKAYRFAEDDLGGPFYPILFRAAPRHFPPLSG